MYPKVSKLFYFWRDVAGHEIDCIIDESQSIIPVEIKAGQTVVKDFFKELEFWQKITDNPTKVSYLVYGGDENKHWPPGAHVKLETCGKIDKKVEFS